MKLWLLKAIGDAGWVQNQNIVVVAKNEKRARKIADIANYEDGKWLKTSYATCEELLPKGDERVVIVDNNGS